MDIVRYIRRDIRWYSELGSHLFNDFILRRLSLVIYVYCNIIIVGYTDDKVDIFTLLAKIGSFVEEMIKAHSEVVRLAGRDLVRVLKLCYEKGYLVKVFDDLRIDTHVLGTPTSPLYYRSVVRLSMEKELSFLLNHVSPGYQRLYNWWITDDEYTDSNAKYMVIQSIRYLANWTAPEGEEPEMPVHYVLGYLVRGSIVSSYVVSCLEALFFDVLFFKDDDMTNIFTSPVFSLLYFSSAIYPSFSHFLWVQLCGLITRYSIGVDSVRVSSCLRFFLQFSPAVKEVMLLNSPFTMDTAEVLEKFLGIRKELLVKASADDTKAAVLKKVRDKFDTRYRAKERSNYAANDDLRKLARQWFTCVTDTPVVIGIEDKDWDSVVEMMIGMKVQVDEVYRKFLVEKKELLKENIEGIPILFIILFKYSDYKVVVRLVEMIAYRGDVNIFGYAILYDIYVGIHLFDREKETITALQAVPLPTLTRLKPEVSVLEYLGWVCILLADHREYIYRLLPLLFYQSYELPSQDAPVKDLIQLLLVHRKQLDHVLIYSYIANGKLSLLRIGDELHEKLYIEFLSTIATMDERSTLYLLNVYKYQFIYHMDGEQRARTKALLLGFIIENHATLRSVPFFNFYCDFMRSFGCDDLDILFAGLPFHTLPPDLLCCFLYSSPVE